MKFDCIKWRRVWNEMRRLSVHATSSKPEARYGETWKHKYFTNAYHSSLCISRLIEFNVFYLSTSFGIFCEYQGPFLLTWIKISLSMDMLSSASKSMVWNYLSIPKLQRYNCWNLGMDRSLHPTIYNWCNYLSMMGLKLNHVSKWAPGVRLIVSLNTAIYDCSIAVKFGASAGVLSRCLSNVEAIRYTHRTLNLPVSILHSIDKAAARIFKRGLCVLHTF